MENRLPCLQDNKLDLYWTPSTKWYKRRPEMGHV